MEHPREEQMMWNRILASNWVAVPAVLVATASLGLLYFKGKIFEAIVGGIFLLVSVILIMLGGRNRSPHIKD